MGWEKPRPQRRRWARDPVQKTTPALLPSPTSSRHPPPPIFSCLSHRCSQAPHFLKPIPPPSASQNSELFPATGPSHPQQIPVPLSPSSSFLPASSFLLTSSCCLSRSEASALTPILPPINQGFLPSSSALSISLSASVFVGPSLSLRGLSEGPTSCPYLRLRHPLLASPSLPALFPVLLKFHLSLCLPVSLSLPASLEFFSLHRSDP